MCQEDRTFLIYSMYHIPACLPLNPESKIREY